MFFKKITFGWDIDKMNQLLLMLLDFWSRKELNEEKNQIFELLSLLEL